MTMKKMISLALAVCMALALAVPVGAAVDVEEVDAVSETTRELIDNIYTHQDKYTIYDKDGNDITNDFIARNQENYATGDIASIADDMVENGVGTFRVSNPEFVPMVDIFSSVYGELTMTYQCGNKKVTSIVDAKIKAKIHDYNSIFVSVEPAVLVNLRGIVSGSAVSGGGYNERVDGAGTYARQNIMFRITKSGKTVYSNWTSSWKAGNKDVTCTKINQVGSL